MSKKLDVKDRKPLGSTLSTELERWNLKSSWRGEF